MPKPEIAIQLDSEKPIIADQNRIFLTNKKAFTVHRHCPKCNDSTAARKVIILSRPGQPGSAKRHNSDLTWIYMKSVLSFCPKEEFSTFTFTDERDSDKRRIVFVENGRDVVLRCLRSADPAALLFGIRHARLHSGPDDRKFQLREHSRHMNEGFCYCLHSLRNRALHQGHDRGS